MLPKRRYVCFCTLLQAISFSLISMAASSDERCPTAAASLVSADGTVLWRNGTTDWTKAKPNQAFCTGDSIRVESERAALRLANNTVVRLKEKTLITLLPEEKSFWLELKEGAAHFLTRTPKAFTIKAPYLNAAVDGTEFVVNALPTQNEVLVFEGQVTTSNDFGSIVLSDGMTAFSTANTAPKLGTKIRLQDSAEWTLYYPPLFIDTPTSIEVNTLIEQHHYQQAIEEIGSTGTLDTSSIALQASLAMAIGQNTEAKILLNKALTQDTHNADALALRIIILLVESNAQQALSESTKLSHNHPNILSAQLAHSYALQANGKIEQALDIAREAFKNYPDNSYIVGRLIELSLSNGDTRYAKKHLESSLDKYSKNSRLQTLAGFVMLNQLAGKEALKHFNRAIELNGSDSLSYLGRALALIQQGNLEQGRQQMELAVLLDPSSSLLRSYLGKTYFEGNHSDWSATQYQLAKTLDPNDPTPWFYEAHLKMEQNKPAEALALISNAIEKNDNRAVYRSRLLLDSDAAARSANQAGIYQQLGFDELAKNTAAMAVNDNPTDFATHQALALAYSKDPKAQKVRADEALLTKLYQPIGSKALSVGIGAVGLQSLPWLSPSEIGLNEYSSLFTQKGLSGDLSLFEGTQDSKGYEVQAQLTGKNTSFDAGQYKYQTDGFRDNNYLNEEISEIGIHYQALDNLKFFAQHTQRKHTAGDLVHAIDADAFDGTLFEVKNWNTSELGLNFKIDSNNTIIVHTAKTATDDLTRSIYSEDDYILTTKVTGQNNTYKHELAYIYHSNLFKSHIGHINTKSTSLGRILELDEFGEYEIPFSDNYRQSKSYIHLTVPLKYEIETTLGGAYGKKKNKGVNADEMKNDKEYRLGVSWTPPTTSKLNLNINRWKKSNEQNILSRSLEPSHILSSPLNYEFGLSSKSYSTSAKALWQSRNISGAIQLLQTKIYEPIYGFVADATTLSLLRVRSHKVNLHYQLTNKTSISTLYENSAYDRGQDNIFFLDSIAPTNLHSNVIDFKVTTQLNQHLSLSLNAHRIDQKEDYPQISAIASENKLVLINANLKITLPKKRGVIRVSGHNMLNRDVPLYQGQILMTGDDFNPVAATLSAQRSLTIIYSTRL